MFLLSSEVNPALIPYWIPGSEFWCRWRPDLVAVFELEAGDDLTLQLAVLARFVQDGLAELWDVGSTGFPQHRVQPVVWRRREEEEEEEESVGPAQARANRIFLQTLS